MLCGIALAQAIKIVTVTLSDKTLKLESVTVNGKTFVALEQIKKAFPAALNVIGGTNQAVALQGCLKEFLFNGAWRFRVNSIRYDQEKQGWLLNIELRNGMKKITRAVGSGADNAARDISLALVSGNVLELTTGVATDMSSKVLYKELAPGAAAIMDIIFYSKTDTDRPIKFLWLMSNDKNNDKAPLIKDPAFRVDLTCTK